MPLADADAAYPGSSARKEDVAAWMAAQARARGLPSELPIMAALVESSLSNLDYGDADSVGFFQMRTSIWDSGPTRATRSGPSSSSTGSSTTRRR